MNLGPTQVSSTYTYVLNQSGANAITLGNGSNVNWDAGGIVTKTGNQNISGIKTFVSGIQASGYGESAVLNEFGKTSEANRFGDQSQTNYFGESVISFNYFGNYSNNEFGSYGVNYFGFISENYFGVDSVYNYFGGENNTIQGQNSSVINTSNSYIDGSSIYSTAIGGRQINISHSGATVIADNQSRNHPSKGHNTLSLDFASGVYFRLPQFTGSSTQTGFVGQMAISGGYLYVYLDDSTKWRRIAISQPF